MVSGQTIRSWVLFLKSPARVTLVNIREIKGRNKEGIGRGRKKPSLFFLFLHAYASRNSWLTARPLLHDHTLETAGKRKRLLAVQLLDEEKVQLEDINITSLHQTTMRNIQCNGIRTQRDIVHCSRVTCQHFVTSFKYFNPMKEI